MSCHVQVIAASRVVTILHFRLQYDIWHFFGVWGVLGGGRGVLAEIELRRKVAEEALGVLVCVLAAPYVASM